MEEEGGLRDVVEAVGGGGQGRTRVHHQTRGPASSSTTAAKPRLLLPGGPVRRQSCELALLPRRHPHAGSRTKAASHRNSAQQLSPVVGGQRDGAGLPGRGEDPRRVGDRLRVEGRLRWAEGRVGGAGGRERRSRVRLDGEDLGCGAAGPGRAGGVQDEEAGPVLLRDIRSRHA